MKAISDIPNLSNLLIETQINVSSIPKLLHGYFKGYGIIVFENTIYLLDDAGSILFS